MNVYESIMQGLNEAIAYEKGEKTARSACVTIVPCWNCKAYDWNAACRQYYPRKVQYHIQITLNPLR